MASGLSNLTSHLTRWRLFAVPLILLVAVAWVGPARSEVARYDLRQNACSASAPVDGLSADGPSLAAVKALEYRCGGAEPAPASWLWLRMNPPAEASTATGWWSVLVNEIRYDRAVLIVERATGETDRILLQGSDLPHSWVLGNMLRIDVPASRSPVAAMYLGVEGLLDPGLVQKVDLVTEGAITSWNNQWLLMGGLFVGALSASMLYNLLLLGGVRHRLQLTYLAWMGSTLAYGLSYSGLIHYLSPGMTGTEVARFTYFTGSITLALGVLFFLEFFKEGQLPRWLVRSQLVLATAIFAFAVPGAFDQLGWFQLADSMIRPLIIIAQLLTAIGLVRAIEREPGPALLYGLGWSFPAIAVMADLLGGYGFMGPNIVADAGIFIASVIQALLLSAATAVRLGGLRRERDRAKAESERLRSLAETDPMTSLLNRRGLVHRAQAVMAKGLGSALILIDVDHFKAINDSFGHEVGDRVLIRVGQLLEDQCMSRHPVGRIGGEEFAIVLAADEADDALRYADRIRRHLAGANFADLLGTGRGVTISMGLAVAPATFPATFERLYIAADRALYTAKRGGRNRVEIASIDEIRRAEARLATV